MFTIHHVTSITVAAARSCGCGLLFASSILLAAVSSGCGGSEGESAERVVVYTSADQAVAEPILAAFEAAHPDIELDTRFDTESTKTTGLVTRLRAEADRPRADVFWSSEIFLTVQLAEEGLLEPYASERTADWPESFRDPLGRWTGFAGRARVIAFAPDRVVTPPVTWQDLAEPRYRGRVVMADPNFGTTRGHLATWFAVWGSAEAETYLAGLARNQLRIVASNAQAVREVVAGTADLAMTDTDDVWAARRNGHEVEMVLPRHGDAPEAGTLLIPNTVALIAGRPENPAAGTFIDWLLGPEAQRMLLESDSHNVPIGVDVEVPLAYAIPSPLPVDYEAVAEIMPEALSVYERLLGDEADEPLGR